MSSGAVGLGRQRLRYRQLVNSRFFSWKHPFKFPLNSSKLCLIFVVSFSSESFYSNLIDHLVSDLRLLSHNERNQWKLLMLESENINKS